MGVRGGTEHTHAAQEPAAQKASPPPAPLKRAVRARRLAQRARIDTSATPAHSCRDQARRVRVPAAAAVARPRAYARPLPDAAPATRVRRANPQLAVLARGHGQDALRLERLVAARGRGSGKGGGGQRGQLGRVGRQRAWCSPRAGRDRAGATGGRRPASGAQPARGRGGPGSRSGRAGRTGGPGEDENLEWRTRRGKSVDALLFPPPLLPSLCLKETHLGIFAECRRRSDKSAGRFNPRRALPLAALRAPTR